MPGLRVRIDATPLLASSESGVSKFCRGLVSELAHNPAIDTSVFAITWRKLDQLRTVIPAGAKVVGRPMPARPLRLAWQRVDWPPVEWFLGASDVVHGTNFVVPPTAAAARVVTVHDLTPVKYPELCDPASLVFRDMVERAAAHGAWIHTPSTFVANEVIDVFDVDSSRVRAIPSGIPGVDAALDVAAESNGTPSALPDPIRSYILAIGTIEPRKGYPDLVAAFDRIAGERADLGLVIVGADGWGLNDFDRARAASPWPDRIIRPGYVADHDLGHWLSSAAVLAYPSRYEGFGFPPLMSMALGVPVVATTAGAIPEVVGEAASLVPVGDVDALAEALAAVLDDQDLADSLRASGIERARLFTWARCGSEMVDLYDAAARAASR